MSTDIIRFQKGDSGKPERVFSSEALQLFLAITLPLMVVSFLAWGVFYYWVTTLREKLRLVNAKGSGAEP
jgi:hypothetical protein